MSRLLLLGLVLVSGCARSSNSYRVERDSGGDGPVLDIHPADTAWDSATDSPTDGPTADGPTADGPAPDSPADSSSAPGPLVLYQFDEGSGAVIHDRSGSAPALDLQIINPADVSWQSGGLKVANATVIQSGQVATKVITACKQSNTLSVEAWVTPASASQIGDPRIATISTDPFHRNLTLFQDGTAFMARIRTTSTGVNGLPELQGPTQTATNQLTHLVFTRDVAGVAGNDTLYVNGKLNASRTTSGDLSNWEDTFHLALANEPDATRPWLGTFHLVAIYGRTLSATEVQQHFQAGVP